MIVAKSAVWFGRLRSRLLAASALYTGPVCLREAYLTIVLLALSSHCPRIAIFEFEGASHHSPLTMDLLSPLAVRIA